MRRDVDILPTEVDSMVDSNARAHVACVNTYLCDGTPIDPKTSLPKEPAYGLSRTLHIVLNRKSEYGRLYVRDSDQLTTILTRSSTP